MLTPPGGFAVSGWAGGPFTPTSKAYTWTNAGPAVQYQRVVSQPWVTAAGSSSGTLAAGQSLAFTVSINASQAASLPSGTHTAEV
ncbi:MAG TPA: hypothetical protein VFD82_07435, partial [Planctomycetota bacterium]|nr:hypothetical protein [Planctomycetota bacterium]